MEHGRPATLASVGEQFLLDRFSARPLTGPLLVGPGDDCSVSRSSAPHVHRLLKTDCVIAGVHFEHGEDFTRVGRKALARAISDIAAMGGTPEEALVTLVLPPKLAIAKIDQLYTGIDQMAAEHGVVIAGGETASAPPPHHDATVINIALTGRVAADACVTRSGGNPGDFLFVTGKLGGSIKGHHLDFTPRLAEGQWLAAHNASAMMDLSDGLAKDLPRLARQSGCAYRINQQALPLRESCSITQALNDGEDYELLVAIPATLAASVSSDWAVAFPALPLTHVGELLDLHENNTDQLDGGYDHFSKP